MDGLPILLGVGAAVLLVAAFAVRISVRLGLPSLLIYLGIGLLLGEGGLGISFENAELTQELGIAALVLILAEGGLTTRWESARPVLGQGVSLGMLAVLVSLLVTGGMLHLLLDMDWRTALLWGAVLSSTDAAAVFSVMRGVRVGRRLAGTLELESGLNDPPVYLAVMLLVSDQPFTWWTPLLVVYQLVAGALIGVLLGWLGALVLRRVALPATGLYPLATVSVCVLAYAVGQFLQASGLLGSFFAGLVLGNSRLPHRSDTLSFAEGLAWLAQIGLFVLLGLFASPERLPHAVLPALVVGLVLVVVARPVSVVIAVAPFRVPWREQVFLSWAGLRGAVPIVLTLVPFSQGWPGSLLLVDTVFLLVILLTLLQGSTLTFAARLLGLEERTQSREVQVDAAPLDTMQADLLQVRIPPGSRLHGVYLSELRLPVGATVSLVVRDGTGFTPEPGTRLQEGDQLLVVTTAAVRAATEQRIRAVDRAGRFARWLGETGEERRT
ncbi:MAG TPA: potassium/proton antiporter [Pseudonocardiaceae bacterium]